MSLYAIWTLVPVPHTVTFNGNGSDGGATAVQTGSSTAALRSNGFTRTDFAFTGWNTAAGGGGVGYTDGASYDFLNDLTLYAQWVLHLPPAYTVTFDGNGATGGSTGAQISSVARALNGNGFTRTGYTFSGWNTSPTGGGTAYGNGATYGFFTDMSLFAQWTPIPTHTVSFNGNGATGGATAAQTSATAASLNANGFTRTGFTFVGWSTAAAGGGTAYGNGASYDFVADLSLYAQWIAGTVTVSFDGNGSSGGATAAQSSSTPAALNANGFTRTGYTFSGWNTAATGGGKSYGNGASYDFTAELSLFAQWTAIPTRSVSFSGNGSDGGSTPSQSSNVPASLNSNGFTRTGFNFSGWNTAAGGGGTAYGNGASYDFAADLALFAQWTAAPTITPDAPAETPVLANEAKAVHVNVEGDNGTLVPVTVNLPAGVTGVDGSVRITPVSTPESLALGVITVEIQVLDGFGAVIPTLLAPITIHFQSALGENIVAKSNDGITWTPIPLMTGTTLEPGATDGYYLDANGQVIIVTAHLTQFGIKAQQTTVQVRTTATKLVIRATTSISATGGMGTGALVYGTSTPKVCAVTATGVVTALTLGTCVANSFRSGDASYVSTPVVSTNINITSATGSAALNLLKVTGTGTMKRISVNLGRGYANQKILLQLRPVGKTKFATLATITLNGIGAWTTATYAKTRTVVTNSTIQLVVGAKSLAVIKVSGK